ILVRQQAGEMTYQNLAQHIGRGCILGEQTFAQDAAPAYMLRKILVSHFPGLLPLLSEAPDHRKRRHYEVQELLMAAIALFVFKQQSRNAINNDRWSSQAFCSNYEHLFDCRLPHQDTVGLFLERLPGDYL